eukprot:5584947-Heterocapsa_arctica.AAC.1
MPAIRERVEDCLLDDAGEHRRCFLGLLEVAFVLQHCRHSEHRIVDEPGLYLLLLVLVNVGGPGSGLLFQRFLVVLDVLVLVANCSAD